MIEQYCTRALPVRAKQIVSLQDGQPSGDPTWLIFADGRYAELSDDTFRMLCEPVAAALKPAVQSAEPRPAKKAIARVITTAQEPVAAAPVTDGSKKLSIKECIVHAITSGHRLARPIIQHALKLRPDSTEGSIAAALTVMKREGTILRREDVDKEMKYFLRGEK